MEILGTKNRSERDDFTDQLLDPVYDALRDRQPILHFRTFKSDNGVESDLEFLHKDGLDAELGDEEINLKPLWEEVLRTREEVE